MMKLITFDSTTGTTLGLNRSVHYRQVSLCLCINFSYISHSAIWWPPRPIMMLHILAYQIHHQHQSTPICGKSTDLCGDRHTNHPYSTLVNIGTGSIWAHNQQPPGVWVVGGEFLIGSQALVQYIVHLPGHVAPSHKLACQDQYLIGVMMCIVPLLNQIHPWRSTTKGQGPKDKYE